MDIQFDGQSVYAAVGGTAWSEHNRALCLVHGASLDHSVWTLYSRYFARAGYNVLAPDLIGHARTGGAFPTSIGAMADWLVALLEHCCDRYPSFFKAGDISLVGHSMGSLVALESAARGANLFSHLLLLGTAAPMRVGEALLEASKANLQSSRDMVALYGHAYQSQLGGNPVSGINIVNAALALMEQAGDGVMYKGLLACQQYDDALSSAARVSANTSLILGEHDYMTPPAAAMNLHQTLDGSSLTILKNCGHMMMAEQPEETLQAMIAGLARQAGKNLG